jgi:hypothetical protein
MGEYFRPWRRKMGVLTLLMALVFMAGWVRSNFVSDNISSSVCRNRFLSLSSSLETLLVATIVTDIPDLVAQGPQWHTDTPKSTDIKPLDDPEVECKWRCCQFGYGELSRKEFDENLQREFSFDVAMTPFPYWFITIPLTLLSTYLLLSKPRPGKPPAIEMVD